MIDLTRLIRGLDNRPEQIRYENRRASDALVPLVVWNTTPACNLRCKHCYFGACDERDSEELSTAEAKAFIDSLAAVNVPVLVFSGGEPFFRDDIAELTRHASARGIRPIASSNGTFLTEERAQAVADAGMQYVGVSLDGVGATNDEFRGVDGAFERARNGLRNARDAGMGTGIRCTMTEGTVDDVPDVIDLAVEEGIDRVNVFHLIYSGRGGDITDADLSVERTRAVVDSLYERTKTLAETYPDMQLLTAGNYADAVYLYHRIREDMPAHADRARKLLFDDGPGRVVKNGDAGPKVVNVDHRGDVHPSMFLSQYTLGNVRDRRLDEILADSDLWDELAEPTDHLKGKCGRCPWKEVCGGNSRARAAAVHDDLWAEDPRCYLTEAEYSTDELPTDHAPPVDATAALE
ncbi:radical SAM/SPASM domain-containing protein [Natrinema pallidum]|uniref:Radical SAM domain protein n=1 Tax=Natrinema pallidum DSM 3751 TaxID=1227495 RepID=L9YLL4_9EURY|nr:radical SAM protein [Natrinema pallidum]ELY74541.1 Radical SAM domain protein [Natrinema pallidum DSM 3751]